MALYSPKSTSIVSKALGYTKPKPVVAAPKFKVTPSAVAPSTKFTPSAPASSGSLAGRGGTSNSTPQSVSPGSSTSGQFAALGRAIGGGVSKIADATMGGSKGSSAASVIGGASPFVEKFGGKVGTSTITSPANPGSRGGLSLEAISRQNMDAAVGSQVGGERTGRMNFLDTSSKNREAQRAALTSQINNTKAAYDAALAAEAEGSDLITDLDGDNEIDTTEAQYANEEKESIRIEKELRELERAYQKAGELTPEEIEAKRLEDELTAQESAINAQVGEETTAINTQPIPQGFLTGQGKAVFEKGQSALTRIAAQKIPLQQRLANIIAKRKMAEEAARDSYSNRLSASERASSRSKERREYTTALSLEDRKRNQKIVDDYNKSFSLSEGQSMYRVNPQTGQIELVASKPKTYAPKSTTEDSNPFN